MGGWMEEWLGVHNVGLGSSFQQQKYCAVKTAGQNELDWRMADRPLTGAPKRIGHKLLAATQMALFVGADGRGDQRAAATTKRKWGK
jgi:hypothetical protein